MHWIYYENQYGTGNRSKEGTKEWYYIGNADDHTDQHRIRQFHNTIAYKAQDPDNDGVNNLSAQETTKCLVCKTKVLDEGIGRILLKQRKRNLFCISGKLFLACQYIDGNDKTDHKIPKHAKEIQDTDGHGLD